MKIQLSPVRIVKDAITVWSDKSDEVDVVMDLKNLTFREGSIDELYAFHVADHLFPNEVSIAIHNWRKCLGAGKKLYVVVDDFEYLCRAIIGGDMSIDELNENFAHPTNITRDNLLEYMKAAGFTEEQVRIWYDDVTDQRGSVIFPKQHYELIFDATKN